MNKFLLLICSCLLLIFDSCKQDENNLSTIGGYIDIKLSADSNVLESESRGVRSSTPDIGDFGLNVLKSSGEILAQWEKFSDFKTTGVPAGKYVVEAYYGNKNEEGFDALSYYGSSQVATGNNEIVETSVVCTINKALVSISYTDSFKEYFKSYKGYISTSKGNKIVYEDGEDEVAYFVPGELDVFLEVTREGVQDTVRLNPKTFKAEARTEYRLTMDVDVSTSTLTIIFNDRPSDYMNVTINISDAMLNAEPPKFTLYGFESGKDLEILEHSDFAETLQAYLNAPAGISKCKLISNSAYLKSLGVNWKDTLDLANLNTEEKGMVSSMGLETIGLGDRKDQIAVINFNKFVSKLGCMADTNEVHRFILAATDKLSKVSDTIYFNVVTRANQFAFAGPAEPVSYGSTYVEFDLTLEGVHDDVVFKENSGNGFVEIDQSRITITPNTEDNLKSKVTITFENPLFDTENAYVVKAEYGGKVLDAKFEVDTPVLTLSLRNGDADVWATKAYFTVEAKAKGRSSRTISTETIKIQYKNGEEWVDFPNQTYDSDTNTFEVTGIGGDDKETVGKSYTVRAVYVSKGLIDDGSVSNEITITTEPKLQLPNSGFEDWYYTRPDGVKYWEIWYPCKEGETPVWGTMNQWTTSEGGTSTSWWNPNRDGCRYNANSGTIKEESGFSGNAALIRAVGWGKGNDAAGYANAKYGTVGELYTGTYDPTTKKAVYSGVKFKSRPNKMNFKYKYRPGKGGDQYYAEVLLYDEYDNEIGSGIKREGNEVSNWADGTIDIVYTTVNSKTAKIVVKFKSGDKDNNDSFIDVPDFGNTDTGEYVGSKLYIDDVKLIYE